MAIVFPCECGQELQAKDEQAGLRTRCPQCGKEVVVPGIQMAPAATASPRPEAVTKQPRADAGGSRADEEWEERGRRPRPASSGSSAWVVILVLGILGAVGVVCLIPALLIALLLPAVQKVREAAVRIQGQNNLHQLALGMHNFNDDHGQLPPAVVYDRDGKPLYSWRVLLLPYLGEENLYRDFHLDEPWDSPHNKALLSRMPKVYARPGATPGAETTTFYQVFDGPGAAFDSSNRGGLKPFDPNPRGALGPGRGLPPGLTLQQGASISRIPATFADGMANMFLIVEAGDPVEWTRPADLHWDPNGPLPKLGGVSGTEFSAAFADGSVRRLPKSLSPQSIRAGITANAGDLPGPDW
jgi:hypothetical protein